MRDERREMRDEEKGKGTFELLLKRGDLCVDVKEHRLKTINKRHEGENVLGLKEMKHHRFVFCRGRKILNLGDVILDQRGLTLSIRSNPVDNVSVLISISILFDLLSSFPFPHLKDLNLLRLGLVKLLDRGEFLVGVLREKISARVLCLCLRDHLKSANNQTIKQSDNQTIRQSDNQTIRQSDNQTIR